MGKTLIKLACLVFMLNLLFVACTSDDENDFRNHAENSFVHKSYVYQWTLQNTSTDFQHILHFSSDSTFTFNTIKVETGKSTTNGPMQGTYKKNPDGSIVFIGSSFKTNVKGQRETLHKAHFTTQEEKLLNVYRTLDFSSGNSRKDWLEYKLK